MLNVQQDCVTTEEFNWDSDHDELVWSEDLEARLESEMIDNVTYHVESLDINDITSNDFFEDWLWHMHRKLINELPEAEVRSYYINYLIGSY